MQPKLDEWLNAHRLLHGFLAQLLREVHATEMWATHGAEVSCLGSFGREGLVMVCLRRLRIEREVELVLPAELEARFGERVVVQLRPRMSLSQIGGVRGNLVGNHSVFYVIFVG